ncbi:unnamed protein product, partial [Schistocephalus solidus]|uniref:Uncharacterized protein n=1 Tax=Schistocephalus solidus TaxID=70667 RepID=A0A183SWW6_SCHSO
MDKHMHLAVAATSRPRFTRSVTVAVDENVGRRRARFALSRQTSFDVSDDKSSSHTPVKQRLKEHLLNRRSQFASSGAVSLDSTCTTPAQRPPFLQQNSCHEIPPKAPTIAASSSS